MMRAWRWSEQIRLDLRFALRSFVKSPGFALAALVTLALGIGLNTAMFSTVNSVLLRPLPYRDADRLVQLWETHPVIHQAQVTYPNFKDWRTESTSFEEVAAYTFEGFEQFNLVVNNQPERVQVSLVSENLLPLLGVTPLLGRNFHTTEMSPGHDDAVLLSDALWQRRFGADPHIVGRSVQIDGTLYRVLGVLPAGKQFPTWADLLLPVSRMDKEDLVSRKHHQLEVIALLKPGVPVQQAQAELSGIAKRLENEYPATNKSIGAKVIPLQEQVTGPVRVPLLILLGAVGLILVIACANVANLLLARSVIRRKEIALRLALGASRSRLISQLLTESLLLASLGGCLGVALASAGIDVLKVYAREELPRTAELSVDGRALLFALAVTGLSSLLCGLLPALQSSRDYYSSALKEAGRGSLSSFHRSNSRRMLAAGEVALAVVVLVGAGLLVRSFQRVLAVDLGFRADHLLTFQVTPSPAKYKTDAQLQTFFSRIQEGLHSIPSVKDAATAYPIPFTANANRTRFLVEGSALPEAGKYPVT